MLLAYYFPDLVRLGEKIYWIMVSSLTLFSVRLLFANMNRRPSKQRILQISGDVINLDLYELWISCFK